ncbi:MAG: hypothetical protein M3460_09955 [Actinomycetota bacterium]|nr:hypothetical protein [Actinomycetota bacterium]
MNASHEMQAAVTVLRSTTAPGAAQIADLLEETARMACINEGAWELAGYSDQHQKQLAEGKWRLELAMARTLVGR